MPSLSAILDAAPRTSSRTSSHVEHQGDKAHEAHSTRPRTDETRRPLTQQHEATHGHGSTRDGRHVTERTHDHTRAHSTGGDGQESPQTVGVNH